MQKLQRATYRYERWLARYTTLLPDDLKLKYRLMAQEPFSLLRATFYRWMQLWPTVRPADVNAPVTLAVGDLHVENFGTWRDAEGRLVWGINDFDEAAHLPYTQDLTRLATSALLAIRQGHLHLTPRDACAALRTGYTEGLKAGGKPFVLAEENDWLRRTCLSSLRDPVAFWQKMDTLTAPKEAAPESALTALEHALPLRSMKYAVRHRVAGVGSLGHPRYVALAEWEGARIAREAKALVPSAALWARDGDDTPDIYYQAVLDRAVRCRDPFMSLQGRWIVRRLAPDCSRVELAMLSAERDETQLLHAMGWETANAHLALPQRAKDILADLGKRGKEWLLTAAHAMAEATETDWKSWHASPHPDAGGR